MASLSKHKIIYIFTHDFVLLGEDELTHQPIESLTLLKSISNLLIIRPYDTTEIIGAYQIALDYNGSIAIILTRHIVHNIDNSNNIFMKKSAYIIYEGSSEIKLIIISTGSKVFLELDTINNLKDNNFKNSIRLVSMPCSNLFDIQNSEYKESILPKNIKKISIEAGCTLGWYKYADIAYGIDTFGESENINDLREHFGLTIKKFTEFIFENL